MSAAYARSLEMMVAPQTGPARDGRASQCPACLPICGLSGPGTDWLSGLSSKRT